MKHYLTIIGARPQFIKAAALSSVFSEKYSDKVTEHILHTGQHYDDNMSQVFFDEMNIPRPELEMSLRSKQPLAEMIEGIMSYAQNRALDGIILYGDTNSTLAGAIAGIKCGIPLAHIEAGLRSFNRSMPEEMNRVLTDHSSTLLFCPTDTAINNLQNEGIHHHGSDLNQDHPGIFKTGDVMMDCALKFGAYADQKIDLYKEAFNLPEHYILCTVHRDFNTDNLEKLNQIMSALEHIGEHSQKEILLPVHPRTKKQMSLSADTQDLVNNSKRIRIMDPVSYTEMLFLEKHADFIITDSGGVQKEAYFFEKPCLVLRPETEWVEIVENGCAVLAHSDTYDIVEKYRWFTKREDLTFPPLFGDGRSADFIASTIFKHF